MGAKPRSRLSLQGHNSAQRGGGILATKMAAGVFAVLRIADKIAFLSHARRKNLKLSRATVLGLASLILPGTTSQWLALFPNM